MGIIDTITQVAVMIGAIAGTILTIIASLTALGIKRAKWMEQLEKAAKIGVLAAEQWAANFAKTSQYKVRSEAKSVKALEVALHALPTAPEDILKPLIEAKVRELFPSAPAPLPPAKTITAGAARTPAKGKTEEMTPACRCTSGSRKAPRPL